jgi:hypothetical protein
MRPRPKRGVGTAQRQGQGSRACRCRSPLPLPLPAPATRTLLYSLLCTLYPVLHDWTHCWTTVYRILTLITGSPTGHHRLLGAPARLRVKYLLPPNPAHTPPRQHMCAQHTPQAQPEEGTLAPGSAGWRKPKTPQSTSEHPHRRRGVLRLAPLKVEAPQLGQVEVAGETEPGAARPRRRAPPARSNLDTERRQQSGPRSQTSTMGSRPGFASPLGDPGMGSEVWS